MQVLDVRNYLHIEHFDNSLIKSCQPLFTSQITDQELFQVLCFVNQFNIKTFDLQSLGTAFDILVCQKSVEFHLVKQEHTKTLQLTSIDQCLLEL